MRLLATLSDGASAALSRTDAGQSSGWVPLIDAGRLILILILVGIVVWSAIWSWNRLRCAFHRTRGVPASSARTANSRLSSRLRDDQSHGVWNGASSRRKGPPWRRRTVRRGGRLTVRNSVSVDVDFTIMMRLMYGEQYLLGARVRVCVPESVTSWTTRKWRKFQVQVEARLAESIAEEISYPGEYVLDVMCVAAIDGEAPASSPISRIGRAVRRMYLSVIRSQWLSAGSE